MLNLVTTNNLKNYKNQKLKIGILGGSFDPPHIGHIHLAREAVKRTGFDEIWFAVSQQNPLKPAHFYSYEKRVKLLAELIGDDTRFKILTIENELKIKLTADLFDFLKKELSDIEFCFIIGADLAEKIHEWEKFDELIKLTKLVIFSRAGYSHQVQNSEIMKKYAKSGKVQFIPISEIDISSTQIRKELKDKYEN